MANLLAKILADVSKHQGRFILAALGIAAGVFCLGTLIGMLSIQSSQMNLAHIASEPAHIVMMLRNSAPDETLTELKSIAGIQNIAAQSQTTIRYRKPGESLWSLATLLVRPDYRQQQYERISLLDGDWPERDFLALESMSAAYFGIPLNSRLQFQSRTDIRDMTIRGLIRHPFIKPPRFGGQLLIAASPEAGRWFGLSPSRFNQLLIRVENPENTDRTQAIASAARLKLASLGYVVSATLLQDPDKHWGHVFFAGVDKVLTSMAWASLLLASLLTLNSVSAHMTEQNVQIAIMKSIGGSTRLIGALYLIEIVMLACIALAIAMPAGIAAANIGSKWLLALFNITPAQWLYPMDAMAAMLICGIGMPVLAAIGPILKAVRQPIRQGLDTHGIGNDFGRGRFDVGLENYVLTYLPTSGAYAIANIFRNKRRLLWIQASLITAGVIFLVIASLRASVDLTLDNELERTRYAVRLGLTADVPQHVLSDLTKTLPATTNIEFWRRSPIEILGQDGKAITQKGSLGLQLLALPSASQSYKPRITAGRWLQSSDAGRKVLVISAETASLNGLHIGDTVNATVAAQQEQWLIVGTYRWLAGANFVIEPVYSSLETLETLLPQKKLASFVVTSASLGDLDNEQTYLKSLLDLFWKNGMLPDIYSTAAKLGQRQHAQQQLLPVTGMLYGLSAMVAAIAGIALAGALAMNVMQRKREIAVLRAIGARNRSISGMIVLEGLLHGLLAWLASTLIALVCAKPAAALLGQTMFGINLDYRFDNLAVAVWFAGALLISVAASWWPARLAMKINVRTGLE